MNIKEYIVKLNVDAYLLLSSSVLLPIYKKYEIIGIRKSFIWFYFYCSRLLMNCGHLWQFEVICGSFGMFCSHLLVVCGGLLSFPVLVTISEKYKQNGIEMLFDYFKKLCLNKKHIEKLIYHFALRNIIKYPSEYRTQRQELVNCDNYQPCRMFLILDTRSTKSI